MKRDFILDPHNEGDGISRATDWRECTKIRTEEVRRAMGGMMINRMQKKGAYNKLYGIALMLVLFISAAVLIPCVSEAGPYAITSCGDCHDNPPADGTARNNPEGAVVGSHNKHATTYSLACTVCHVNNTTYNHRNGNIEMVSPLNNHSGSYSKGTSFAQSNNPTLGTCSTTYCHSTGTGGTSQSGDARPVAANTTPTWGNNGTISCNSCHGVEAGNDGTGRPHYASGSPKANSHEASTKHASLTCDKCHYQTTTTGNTITTYANHANRVYNVNGSGTAPYTLTYTYNATGGTCTNTYCHSNAQTVPPGGALTYQSPAWGNSASGACGTCHGTDSDPNKMATATHTKHVSTTGYNLACTTCHSGAGSGTVMHADYSVDVAIDAGIGGGSYSGSPAPGDPYGSCTSTYCHSQGQSNSTPFTPAGNLTAAWNTTFTDSCKGCHNAAVSVTPADSTDIMATNKHSAHVNNISAVGKTVGCAECHNATASNDTTISGYANHVNRLVNVKFDNVVNLNTDNPTYNGSSTTGAAGATKTPGSAVGSCANVYCHSSGNLGTGSNLTFRSVAWNGTAIGCDGCHGNQAGKAHPIYTNGGAGNVNANSHVAHVENAGKTCDICHYETTTDTAIPPATVRTDLSPSRHINRTENVTFNTSKAGASATWTAGTKTCSNLACHGNVQWGGTLGCVDCHAVAMTSPVAQSIDSTVTQRRAIVPEFQLASNHVRNKSGGVTNADCGVCHMEGNAADGSKNPTYHANGYVELRDPDTGTLIQQAQWSGTGAGSFASTATDARFVRFSRNLSTHLQNDTNYLNLAGVQINHCLKCHDNGGAASTSARVTGGTATNPFNATAGGIPGGRVVDVYSQFATTNRAYHPILGKQNNSYAANTRMNAPWNISKTNGNSTSWGYIMTCWDCHAPNGATGTLTSTVTAHGSAISATGTTNNAVELRGYIWRTGAVGSANNTTLCIICHAGYDTQTASNHGTGSAFTSNTNNGMTLYLRYACYYCHSAGPTKPARPIPAADAHGYNTRSNGTNFSAANYGYAFIRSEGFYGKGYYHSVLKVGATNYTPQCTGFSGTNGSTNCAKSMGNYTPGGVY